MSLGGPRMYSSDELTASWLRLSLSSLYVAQSVGHVSKRNGDTLSRPSSGRAARC